MVICYVAAETNTEHDPSLHGSFLNQSQQGRESVESTSKIA
jgi:hypothetical protein